MSEHWISQLILLPVLLPLVCGALMVLLTTRRHRLKFYINLFSTTALLIVALALIFLVDTDYWQDGTGIYLAANWRAPFGIVLMVDRLSALMLLLTSVVALATLFFSSVRWSRVGVHFHSLLQFLLMGINGAVLTGDLFNLFVFFEVMLASSYGLVLHGYNTARIRAGMQYIVVNLLASFFFLIGVALIYAATGTLNIADLAYQVPQLQPANRTLLEVGAAILAIAFLTKSAMWPLGFWLPATYSAASPPAAAMLALMTKVGVYVVLRLWLMVFSGAAGESAGYGSQVLMWGGLATLAFGTIGLLASQEPGRLAGYSAIVSSGTLLAAIGYGQPSLVSSALFYLLSSTLAISAFLLLMDLVERIRSPAAAMLALTTEAFAIEDDPKESVGVAIPAAMAFLGLAFAGCALIISGLPPLSGFIGKFSLFHALLNPEGIEAAGGAGMAITGWSLLVLIIVSGLAAIIALMRFGVRTFWTSSPSAAPRLQIAEAAPISLLLLLCVMMTIQAGPVMAYLDRTSDALHQPGEAAGQVLSTEPKPGVIEQGEQP